MNSFTIKKLQQSDLVAVAPIENRVQQYPWSAALLDSCFKKSYTNWGIWVQGQLAGYLFSQQILDEVSLLNIAVDNTFQRLGYADQLHQTLVEHARLMKAAFIWLEVRSDNLAAVCLYQKQGYQAISVRKNYYAEGVDAVNFRLDL